MNKLALLLLVITPLCSSGQEWSIQDRKKVNESRNIEDHWDMELFEEDLQVLSFNQKFGPMNYGAFPTPDYDLVKANSFTGLSSVSTCYQPFQIDNKQVVFTAFGMKDSPYYPFKQDGRNSQMFFTIVTITDTIDAEGYNTARYQIISRNHPDYVGQGFIMNKVNQVDYVAFCTPEQNDYAVINTRLFHLSEGRFIVIAPLKNGSLRSLQLKESPKSMEEIRDFVENELIQRVTVRQFLLSDQSI